MKLADLTTAQLEVLARRIEERSIPVPWSGCRLWLGAVNDQGYGQTWAAGQLWYVHRITLWLTMGAFDERLQILHSCDVPSCIEPCHLAPGTDQENRADMAMKWRGSKSSHGFYGAHFSLHEGKGRPWASSIQFRNKAYYLGAFSTAEEASRVAIAFKTSLYSSLQEQKGTP